MRFWLLKQSNQCLDIVTFVESSFKTNFGGHLELLHTCSGSLFICVTCLTSRAAASIIWPWPHLLINETGLNYSSHTINVWHTFGTFTLRLRWLNWITDRIIYLCMLRIGWTCKWFVILCNLQIHSYDMHGFNWLINHWFDKFTSRLAILHWRLWKCREASHPCLSSELKISPSNSGIHTYLSTFVSVICWLQNMFIENLRLI